MSNPTEYPPEWGTDKIEMRGLINRIQDDLTFVSDARPSFAVEGHVLDAHKAAQKLMGLLEGK